MSEKIAEILAECIEAIDSGELSIEQCLARYPQHRKELLTLLKTQQELIASPAVAPRPAFRRSAKARLTNRLPDQGRSSLNIQLVDYWRMKTKIFQRSLNMRWITLAIVAVLATLFSGVGAAYASGDALPGDTLYSVKTGLEGVRLTFSGDEGDANLYNEFADTRVAEIQSLIDQDRLDDIPAAVQGYENSLAGLAQTMARLSADDPARADAQAALNASARENRTQVLTALLDKVPEQALQGIQRALEAGPPENQGQGQGQGGCPPANNGNGNGRPEGAGPPEDSGPPENSNAPDGAGPPENAGPQDRDCPPEEGGNE